MELFVINVLQQRKLKAAVKHLAKAVNLLTQINKPEILIDEINKLGESLDKLHKLSNGMLK